MKRSLIPAASTLLLLMTYAASAGGQIAVLGSTLEERISAPGETYSGAITVVNDSEAEQNVRVSQTDYMFFADGRSPFDTPGSNARSNAAWVRPSVSTIRMAPRSQTGVTFSVTVPADTTLAGSYWSTIVIEPIRDARAITTKAAVGVGTSIRYAVQVATHISETGKRSVGFPKSALVRAADGSPELQVDVANDGQRAYRPLLWLEVYDSSGELRAKVQQQRGLLYPGCSLRQSFALSTLGAGTFKAVLYADTGAESVSATTLRLEL